MNSLFTCKKNYFSSLTTSVHFNQYYFHPGKKLTFMWSCHFIRFGRGIFDSVVIFYKECSLMFKEVIHILQKKKEQLKKEDFTHSLQSNFRVKLHVSLLLWQEMHLFLLSKTPFIWTDFFSTYIMILSFIKNLVRIKNLQHIS